MSGVVAGFLIDGVGVKSGINGSSLSEGINGPSFLSSTDGSVATGRRSSLFDGTGYWVWGDGEWILWSDGDEIEL